MNDIGINIHDLVQYLIESFAACLGAALMALAHRAFKSFNLNIDAAQRAVLDKAIANGINWAKHAAMNGLLKDSTLPVQNQMVREVAGYMVKYAPDAVAHFGLTSETMATKIWAALGQHLEDMPDEIMHPPAVPAPLAQSGAQILEAAVASMTASELTGVLSRILGNRQPLIVTPAPLPDPVAVPELKS